MGEDSPGFGGCFLPEAEVRGATSDVDFGAEAAAFWVEEEDLVVVLVEQEQVLLVGQEVV